MVQYNVRLIPSVNIVLLTGSDSGVYLESEELFDGQYHSHPYGMLYQVYAM